MTTYPTLDANLATLRNAIEGGVKADSMQGLKLMELVDAIGEQFKSELADVAAVAPAVDAGALTFDQWWSGIAKVFTLGSYDENIVLAAKILTENAARRAWESAYRRGFMAGWNGEGEALSIRASDAAAGEPDWRELCRRLYVELFHCNQQMTQHRDENGDAVWTVGVLVLNALRDARAALESHPASEPKAPYLPCPICNGVEGCDHTVPERKRASEPKAPYYLIERRNSTPTIWWKGPRWGDFTDESAKATRYGSRAAAERQMRVWDDDSLFVTEHLDMASRPKALTDEQREALKHLVARGSTFPDHNGSKGPVTRVDYVRLQVAAKVLSELLRESEKSNHA
ncbi:hypothetical protein GCT13_08410 [Paraburkholderia sp. CNPSo 3157]|uniref:Uncharacterized protein n=1 Tax=Paraburkholderia franconis TaxID=2654983 RepID=A0A7X1N7R9_9BURK|nr:hypothetical protein [Paraburkholderia franconis]MPW16953.1 hypothetical protein [Paraburkholderia franconis]